MPLPATRRAWRSRMRPGPNQRVIGHPGASNGQSTTLATFANMRVLTITPTRSLLQQRLRSESRSDLGPWVERGFHVLDSRFQPWVENTQNAPRFYQGKDIRPQRPHGQSHGQSSRTNTCTSLDASMLSVGHQARVLGRPARPLRFGKSLEKWKMGQRQRQRHHRHGRSICRGYCSTWSQRRSPHRRKQRSNPDVQALFSSHIADLSARDDSCQTHAKFGAIGSRVWPSLQHRIQLPTFAPR